jgi:cytohesin
VDAANPETGATALIEAAAQGQRDAVELLLAKGAVRDRRNREGLTALECAVRGKHTEVARLLLDATGGTAAGALLFDAALKGQAEMADLLTGKGANVNARDRSGATPLHIAALKGSLAVAEVLVSRGADVNARDGDGLTPLHDAALSGHADVAALLLDHGADRDARDRSSGATPLYEAAAWGRGTVVELLIERGADVNAKNQTGSTPFQAATSNGYADVARVLKEHGGR